MNGHALGYIYGWGLALFSLTVIPPLIIALANNEGLPLAAFLVTGIASGFLGGSLIIALKGRSIEVSRREKIVLVLALWVTFCLISAIPFEASNAIPSRLNAIFEAASGLTTTGATILEQITNLPKSIIYWRAQLQWVGGFITLFTITYALVRFMGAERVTKEIYKSSNSINDEQLHLFTTLRLIIPVYLGLTILVLLFLLLSSIPIFDAICLALSTVSTGGFMPRDGTLSTYGNIHIFWFMSVMMFLSSVSILWVSYLFKQEWLNLKKFSEPLWVGGSMLFLALIMIILKLTFDEGREFSGFYKETAHSLINAVSLISTTGFAASTHSFEHISPAIAIILMIIGGGVLSTAGGVKFTRIIMMFRQSNRELRSLIYPHEVRPLYLSNENKDHLFISTVWVIFSLTILVIISLAAILSYYGMGLEEAFFAATGMVSNCGACYQQMAYVHLDKTIPLIELAEPAKIAMIVGMIVGRLEILIIISLFNISFWRH